MTTADYAIVSELIRTLYREDPAEEPMSDEKIARTFAELGARPDKGTIIAFQSDSEIIGYSILINFWSNERGGNILTVDELYVAPAFRRRGIASNFIRFLATNTFSETVALQLEVTPRNVRARKLYEALGFTAHKNHILQLKLPQMC